MEGSWFLRNELTGVDSHFLHSLQKVTDDEGYGAAQVLYRVTFSDAHASQMFGCVQSSASRRRYQHAYRRRYPGNVSRLDRIISLRDEIARILGFQNHASMKMEEKMARGIDEVHDVLDAISTRLLPVAKAEDQVLLQQKKSQEPESSATHIDDWDRRFYTNRLSARRRKLDEGKLAEYFEIGHTWRSILRMYERLFELHFCEITGKVETWHDSVRVYSVWDARDVDREFLGYLYVDLHERDGKYRNAHTMEIEPVSPDDPTTLQTWHSDLTETKELHYCRRLPQLCVSSAHM